MKNFTIKFHLSFRAIRVAIRIAACAFVFILAQSEAFGQWKLASGFSNSLGLSNYDQPTGFIAWGDSLLSLGLCSTDNSQPGATPDSLFLSTDHGQTWTDYAGNGVMPMLIVGAGPNAVFYANATISGTNTSALAYSTDGANTWIIDSAGLTVQGLGGGYAASLAAIGNQIYVSEGVGVYKQTALGVVWVDDNAGLGLGSTVPYGQIGGLIAFGNNLFVSAGYTSVFLSANGGAWTAANNGLPTFTANGIHQWYPVDAFATSGSTVFAQVPHDTNEFGGGDLYSSDFYRTKDNGQNWTKMNSAPLNNCGSTYGFIAANTASFAIVLFAVTDSGFYASTDNGATWTQHNDGLQLGPSNFTNSIQVSGGNIVIGTQYSGAYYRSASDFGGAGVTSPSASIAGLDLTLSENPTSGSEENIRYTLSAGGTAQVMLMDELGRSVRMLQNGRASAGVNVISLDPQSLAPGTYFVRATADGMSAMQKLVIAR